VTRSAIVATLFLTCFASAVLSADKKDKEEDKLRMVQGVVTEAQDSPLVGAVVQLKNSKTLQVRSFITQENGVYQFHGLDPNVDYSKEPTTLVEFTLEKAAEGVMLTVTESGFDQIPLARRAKAFAENDLIVSRAGAMTSFELMAAGKPALMVPLPGQLEQRRNAEVQS